MVVVTSAAAAALASSTHLVKSSRNLSANSFVLNLAENVSCKPTLKRQIQAHLKSGSTHAEYTYDTTKVLTRLSSFSEKSLADHVNVFSALTFGAIDMSGEKR